MIKIFLFYLTIMSLGLAHEGAPRLKISIRTDNKDEFEVGTPRVLACVVVGCAPLLNVSWYLGAIMLRPNVYKEVNRGNFTVSSLTFVPSLTDNGKELVCRATNGHLSQIFEDRVTITVGQRPTCLDSTYRTIRATMGESQTLVCMVESEPDPEQFVWSFPGGRTIYTSSKKVPGHKSRYSSALVWVPQKDDYGPVYCRAFNRFGEQKRPCTFSIVDEAPPRTPDCDFPKNDLENNVHGGKRAKLNHGRSDCLDNFSTQQPEQRTQNNVKDAYFIDNPEDMPPVVVHDSKASLSGLQLAGLILAFILATTALAYVFYFVKNRICQTDEPIPIHAHGHCETINMDDINPGGGNWPDIANIQEVNHRSMGSFQQRLATVAIPRLDNSSTYQYIRTCKILETPEPGIGLYKPEYCI